MRPETTVLGNFDFRPAVHRHFPDLPLLPSVREIVDPLSVLRPTRPALVRSVVGQSPRLTPTRIDDIYVPGCSRIGPKSDLGPIRRPLRSLRPRVPEMSQLNGMRPSALQSQISSLPERSDSKAMRFPSGE